MKHHYIYKISNYFLILIFCTFIFLLYVLFYPVTVITPNKQPYMILTPSVRIGQQVIYQVDACKFIGVTGVINRSFVSVTTGVMYPALTQQNKVSIGCSKTNVITTVPLFLPTGKYYISLRVAYKLNVLRTITYNFTTDDFYVIR